jgi:hypothetical protein
MFRVLPAPIIRSTIKTADAIIITVHVSMWCGLNPLKDVQVRESYVCICSFNLILLMGAENTRNMWSNLAGKNKYNCLKLPAILVSSLSSAHMENMQAKINLPILFCKIYHFLLG